MSSRLIGTVARGLCAPSVQPGTDLVDLVAHTVLAAAAQEGIILHSSDLVGVSGTMVARAQNNLVTVDQLAEEVREKFGEDATLGLLWPTFSTSYMAAVLRGIARGCKKLVLQLAYPLDESGRAVISLESLFEMGVDPYEDTLSEEGYLSLFGEENGGSGSGREYMDYCREVAEAEGCEIQFFFCNHPDELLKYTRNILYCHRRRSPRLEKKLLNRGVKRLYGLNDLCNQPREDRGYHTRMGLLGAASDTSDRILLAPRDTSAFEDALGERLKQLIGVRLKVLVFMHGNPKEFADIDAAPLCSMMGDSLSASAPVVLLQGYRPQ